MRLLWSSDSPYLCKEDHGVPTGFGVASGNIISRLSRDTEIDAVGAQYVKAPIFEHGYKLLPTITIGSISDFNFRAVALYSGLNDYDAIVSFFDVWMVQNYPSIPTLKNWIGYFPIDGNYLSESMLKTIDAMTIPVTYSKFAQDECTKFGKDVELIYHGVDQNVFKPIAGIRDESKFTALMVCRNQSRKNIPSMLRIWRQFVKDKKDARLILNMAPLDTNGHDLNDLIAHKYGISDSVFLVKGLKSASELAGVDSLVATYNSADLHVLTTSGEGFGLPILESMACGVPNLVTDYSSCTEFVKGRGLLAKISGTHDGQHGIERALVDEEDFLENLQWAYDNRQDLANMGRKSLEFARSMSWEKTIPKWKKIISEVAE